MRARLEVENHRGTLVPRTLGLWLGAAATVSTVIVAATRIDGSVGRVGWVALAATLLVLAAGLVDDLAPAGPRGVRNHLGALASGQVSTGIVKAIVIVAAAVVSIAVQPGRSGWIRLAGAILVAASANVSNGLDVRPGRAIKFGFVGFLLLSRLPLALLPTMPGVALGAIGVVWFDLRERAMLGDGGANLLGFTIGLGLYVVLNGWGVLLTAALAVVLNVLAETVTLSRVIDAIPPVRWFDNLGRLPG